MPSLAITRLALALTAALAATPTLAQRIENKVAVFAALDKVTARISKVEAALGDTVKFGSLKITPRVCYSRPPTEQPKTDAFVEVDETLLSGQDKRIFNGWMFAESPGLNGVEHPVFDIWLTECRGPANAPQAAAANASGKPGAPADPAAAAPADAAPEPRRRPRR